MCSSANTLTLIERMHLEVLHSQTNVRIMPAELDRIFSVHFVFRARNSHLHWPGFKMEH